MYRIKTISTFGIILLLIISSCKKKDNNNSVPTNQNPGELVIISNSIYANDTNSLEAVYTDYYGKFKNYYYGTFSSDGKPNKITQMIINESSGDTSVNIFFDDKMNVKTLFLTVNGVKINNLLSFDYSVIGKVKLSLFDFDFTSNNSKMMQQIILTDLGNGSYNVAGDTTYKDVIQNPRTTTIQYKTYMMDGIDPFDVNLGLTNGSLSKGQKIFIAMTTALGCYIGKNFNGCLVGFAFGLAFTVTPPANASVLPTPPSNAPPSPQSQTQGTQLQTQAIFIGTTATTGVVPFDDGYYTVEYTDISFEIKQNKQTHGLISANFYATMNEMKQVNSDPIPGYPSNRHTYSLNTYSLNGKNLTINFNQDAISFPQNNADFTGTVNGSTISGTMTLNRTSNGLNCIIYIPMVLLQIN